MPSGIGSVSLNTDMRSTSEPMQHQVVGREGFADAPLIPGECAHEGRMFGTEVGPVAHRLLIHRRTQHLGKRRRFVEGIGGRDFVSSDDDRAPSGEQSVRQAVERRIARATGGVPASVGRARAHPVR